MPNKLEFKEEKHQYLLDGVEIPSFSKIAEAMGITQYYGDNQIAMNFGTAFHLVIKFLDKGTLNRETVNAPLIPLLAGYEKFKLDFGVKVIPEYIENPICSYRYRYGVTPDRVYYVKDELSAVEFKTNSVMPASVEMQTAFQQIAAEEYYGIKIKRRYGVQFPLEGGYKLFPYTNKMDMQTALCFLGSYNWLKKNNLLKEDKNELSIII